MLEPKVVVLEPAGTSVNKEYWKSKATSNSPVYSLRGIHAYDELQIVVNEVGQIKQTVTSWRFEVFSIWVKSEKKTKTVYRGLSFGEWTTSFLDLRNILTSSIWFIKRSNTYQYRTTSLLFSIFDFSTRLRHSSKVAWNVHVATMQLKWCLRSMSLHPKHAPMEDLECEELLDV